jgi:hypothetical protein
MDGPSIHIWHAAISQYPQVFSAINLSQKADEAENVPALSVALSLYLRAPSSSMSGLFCGPFQNEPYHPHECVCGVSFFFLLQINIFLKMPEVRMMFCCTRTRPYIFWSVLSFFFGILHLSLAFYVSKLFLGSVYVCVFLSAHLNMGHNAQLCFFQPGTP